MQTPRCPARSTRVCSTPNHGLPFAAIQVDELRVLLMTFEEDLGKLVHNDALDMVRVGFNLKGFEETTAAYAAIVDRCEG